MRLRISNEGEHAVRVIVDHDNPNDSTLDAEAEEVYDAPQGIIEVRELDAQYAGGEPVRYPPESDRTT